MLPLHLAGDPGRPLSVLALGAHPDDVELGAGGLLTALAEDGSRGLRLSVCVLTGADTGRGDEARHAARTITPDAEVEVHDLPDGRLPEHWGAAKTVLQRSATHVPDLVLAPHPGDLHQDHRLVAELVPQVFRDVLVLGYEIPKWDGDRIASNVYVPLTSQQVEAKWRLLDGAYASQRSKPWWDREVVVGLARLRGVECRATYAEAFRVDKAELRL